MGSSLRRDRKRRPPRGPGERAGLDRDGVLAAARAVAEREGVQALSMRRLAEELGVAANALYSYFPGKAALLDALLDHLLGDISVPAVEGTAWEAPLVQILGDTRRLLLEYTELIPLFLARPGRGPNAMRLGEAMMACFAIAGLEGRAAVDALRILLIFALGFAAHEAPRVNDPAGLERVRTSEATFRRAEGLSHMRAHAGELAQHADDETFQTGLRWLFAGLATDAGKRRRR